MEPTFSSKFMRQLATEPSIAYRCLGQEAGKSFLSLIADFRAAKFAANIPGAPLSIGKKSDIFELEWFVSSTCTLTTAVLAVSSEIDAWKNAHRMNIVSIKLNGEVLS